MGHSHPVNDAAPHAIDPENEVDSKKTASMFFWWSLVLFISLWLSFSFFGFLNEEELIRKVDRAPTTQLDALREQEKVELGGAGSRKSIDDAIHAYARK